MENLAHALLFCQTNDGVGKNLLELLKGLIPGIEAEAALRLELHVDQDLELPLVWYIATVLHSVWNLRQSGTKVQQYLVRAQLEAKINLLRETKHCSQP